MKYLLHSSVIADFLRGLPDVHARLTSTAPIDLGVASISVMELRYSFILRPDLSVKTEAVLTDLLSSVKVLDFGHRDAQDAARILAEAQARNQPFNALSAQICAMARGRDLGLVIANRTPEPHPFSLISGLRLIDWGTQAGPLPPAV
jgi:predicted nucleic acid-binding protein